MLVIAADVGWVSGAFGLAGVVVGWGLDQLSGRRLRAGERQYQEQQRLKERQDEAAALLDEALLATAEKLPTFVGNPAASQAFADAHREWQRGWTRSLLMTDEDVNDRYRCVGLTLFWAQSDESVGLGGNLYVIGQALDDARRGLRAFRLGKQPGQRTFPRFDELRELAPFKGQVRDYEKLHDWLAEHFVSGD